MLIRIFPILLEKLPNFIWIMLAVVIIIRIVSYICAAVRYRKFASLHTYLNKLTGFSVFTVPYFISSPYSTTFSFIVCLVAGLASLEELIIHITGADYDPTKKTACVKSKKQKQS